VVECYIYQELACWDHPWNRSKSYLEVVQMFYLLFCLLMIQLQFIEILSQC